MFPFARETDNVTSNKRCRTSRMAAAANEIIRTVRFIIEGELKIVLSLMSRGILILR